jgi:hypothetical protein
LTTTTIKIPSISSFGARWSLTPPDCAPSAVGRHMAIPKIERPKEKRGKKEKKKTNGSG